jgi:hypothetical protein
MFKKILSILLLLFTYHVGFAQNNGTNDQPVKGNLSKFLDDGKIGNVKNLVRFRMNRVLAGHYGLSYERRFTKKFGMEVGAYLQLFPSGTFNTTARQLFVNLDGEIDPGKSTDGMCYLAYPKLYLTGKTMNNGFYIGLRNYYGTNKTNMYTTHLSGTKVVAATSFSSFFMFGSHQNFRKCYAFGVEAGFGYYNDSYKDVTFAKYSGTSSLVISNKNKSFSGVNMSIDMVFGLLF